MQTTLIGAAMALVLGAGTAAAQTTLFFGEAGPNRGSRAEAIQFFADKTSELSDGEVSFDIQWGGALFKDGAARGGIAGHERHRGLLPFDAASLPTGHHATGKVAKRTYCCARSKAISTGGPQPTRDVIVALRRNVCMFHIEE